MNEELWDEIYALRKKLNNQAKRSELVKEIEEGKANEN